MKINTTILIALILSSFLVDKTFALNADKIIAYPVPFNPKYQMLRIGYKPDVTADIVDRVIVEIFDINGDKVFNREYSSLSNPVIWNGYNGAGKRVKPGLYIIKVTIENTQNGKQGNRLIRILVVH